LHDARRTCMNAIKMASDARSVLQIVPDIAHAQRRAPSRGTERNRDENEDEPNPDSLARHDVAHGMQEEPNSTASPSDIIVP